MILPNQEDRHGLYRNLSRQCEISRANRKSDADRLKSVYLLGTDIGQQALYNKLREWVKWSASNLYVPGDVRWEIEVPRRYGDKFVEQEEAASDDFERYWKESGASLVYDQGVRWAHVWSASVFKVIANQNRPALRMLPDPSDLGVLMENQPLVYQEALCHWYDMDLSSFERMLQAVPLSDDRRTAIRRVAAEHAMPPSSSGSGVLSPAVSSIILTAASPNVISGAVTSMPNIVTALAKVTEPCAQMAELWVRDDELQCYRKVTLHVPTLEVFFDQPMGATYGPEHPFHALVLDDEVPGYLWGLSPMDFLIGLQAWREQRMAEIDRRERLSLSPPRAFNGYPGLTDEQADRMRTPDGWVASSLPTANVQDLAPAMPPDPFLSIREIDQMFDRQSGMTRGMSGEGEANVRSGDQAMALASLGSPRHQGVAMRVENVAAAIGTQMVRMKARVDDAPIQLADEGQFFLAQLPDAGQSLTAAIAGHSASPYYAQQTRQDAFLAQRLGGIDDVDLVNYLNLPNRHVLRAKARLRMQRKAEMAKREVEQTQEQIESLKVASDAKMLTARAKAKAELL